MVRFVFGVEDVTRIRFALSPMWELVASLVALRDPASAAPHLPWVEEVRPRLAGLDLGAALTLAAPRGYMVDFLTPPPTTPVAEFAEELAHVRATPVTRVRHELEIFRRLHGSSPALDAVAADPEGGLSRLADALEAYWERCVAPWWPRLRALLRA